MSREAKSKEDAYKVEISVKTQMAQDLPILRITNRLKDGFLGADRLSPSFLVVFVSETVNETFSKFLCRLHDTCCHNLK